MLTNMPVTEARTRLTNLASEMKPDETVVITQKGLPTMALMPYGLYDALNETLSILMDPESAALLRQGIKDISEGRVHDWDTVKDSI